MGTRHFDSSKPFFVGMLSFDNIDAAVIEAAAASKLEENAFSAQIVQTLDNGFAGYQGTAAVVAHFRNGVDLAELAADEDGAPDMARRSKALRPRM